MGQDLRLDHLSEEKSVREGKKRTKWPVQASKHENYLAERI